MSGTINRTTNEAARRGLAGVVNKLKQDAQLCGDVFAEPDFLGLANDLGAVLNHVMFGGRAAPAPHRRPGVRR